MAALVQNIVHCVSIFKKKSAVINNLFHLGSVMPSTVVLKSDCAKILNESATLNLLREVDFSLVLLNSVLALTKLIISMKRRDITKRC